MRLAHAMIASAESVLWEARRPRAQLAILMPRSSGFWDDWEVAHPNAVCLCCCVNGAAMSRYVDYTAETYGLYLALATDANIPVGVSLSLACEPSRDLN